MTNLIQRRTARADNMSSLSCDEKHNRARFLDGYAKTGLFDTPLIDRYTFHLSCNLGAFSCVKRPMGSCLRLYNP